MQASNGRHVTRRAFLTLFGAGTSAVVLSSLFVILADVLLVRLILMLWS